MDDVRERVVGVLQRSLQLNVSSGEVGAAGSLDRLLGLDSIAMLEFVLGLEEEFGLTFDPESLGEELFGDLDRLSAHVAARLKA